MKLECAKCGMVFETDDEMAVLGDIQDLEFVCIFCENNTISA